MRLRSLLLLGLVAAASACERPLRAPRVATGPRLRVLTYNVNFGLAGDPAGLEAIEAAGADLVFLQETTPGWEPSLRARLGRRYPHLYFHHAAGAGGLAVLSRYSLTASQLLPSPVGWFPAWRIVARTPVGPVQVLQLHLRPPISDGGSWVSGYFTTGRFRRDEVRHFAGGIDLRVPTLVVGDFNEEQGGQAVRELRDRGLRSVLEEFHPDARTWRWTTSLGRITQTLDHILYTDRLVPVDARVLEAGRSDHLPVVAEFQAS